jgi:hypothetical protein
MLAVSRFGTLMDSGFAEVGDRPLSRPGARVGSFDSPDAGRRSHVCCTGTNLASPRTQASIAYRVSSQLNLLPLRLRHVGARGRSQRQRECIVRQAIERIRSEPAYSGNWSIRRRGQATHARPCEVLWIFARESPVAALRAVRRRTKRNGKDHSSG